jgi:outer membrane lipoprotein carrier protein
MKQFSFKLVQRGSLFFLLLGLAWAPCVLAVTGQSLISEVQKRYETTSDLEANFVQEYVGKVMKRPQRGEGKVFFKKRGMMRWDYDVPNQKFISNGHTLWYYQPEENQVFVSDVGKVLKEKTPLAFLAGEGDLNRDFSVVQFNEAIAQKEENYVLELAPRESQPGLIRLVLTVDKKSYYVLQVDVIDELGNVTRTRFIDIKTNIVLPVSMFQFTIPPGTEVIKAQEQPGSPKR